MSVHSLAKHAPIFIFFSLIIDCYVKPSTFNIYKNIHSWTLNSIKFVCTKSQHFYFLSSFNIPLKLKNKNCVSLFRFRWLSTSVLFLYIFASFFRFGLVLSPHFIVATYEHMHTTYFCQLDLCYWNGKKNIIELFVKNKE